MITYAPIEGQPPTTFDDIVSYNSISDKKGKKPSLVKGIDHLEEGKSAAWKWQVISPSLLTPSHGPSCDRRCSCRSLPPNWAPPNLTDPILTLYVD